MPTCAAYGCTNRFSKKIPGITFHRFPNDPETKKQWVRALRRENWAPTAYSCVCSVHFKECEFDRTSLCRVRLKEGAVPSVFPSFPQYLQKEHKMPRMCCVPGCSSNYKSQKTPPVSTFSFPKDPHRRQQWLKCIRRGNFAPGNSTVVCINHFSERFIIREHKATRNDGTILIIPRSRPKLTDDAYPSVFEIQPSHLTASPGSKRKASNGRRKVALDRVMDVIKTNETEPLTVKTEGTVVADIKAEQNFEDLLLEKNQAVFTNIIKTEHEIDPLTSKNDETLAMDMIKVEHEIDPLVSRNDATSLTDVLKIENEIDPLRPKNGDTNCTEEGDRLEMNVNEIKVESSDLSCVYESDIRCEENVVPIRFPAIKYEIEGERSVTKEEPVPVVMEKNDDLIEMYKQQHCDDHIKKENSDACKVSEEFLNMAKDTNIRYKVTDSGGSKCTGSYKTVQGHELTDAGQEPLKCGDCDKSFRKQCELNKHAVCHTNEKPFKCNKCDKNFRYHRHLTEHLSSHLEEKPFKCTLCDKSYRRQQELVVHGYVHTGEKPFTCRLCFKNFRSAGFLQSHYVTHTHEKKFKCDVCDKSFKRRSGLRAHKVIHMDEKPFKCDACDKEFRRAQDLQDHSFVHTGHKPYKCSECDKSFRRPQRLLNHSITHTSNKPFKCNICDKSYRRRCDLKYHASVHTDQRPFKCNVCDKNFQRRWTLQSHTLTHIDDKPFKCSFCDYSFRRQENLKAHSYIHTGEKRFKCSECEKGFRRRRALQDHLLSHAGGNTSQI